MQCKNKIDDIYIKEQILHTRDIWTQEMIILYKYKY